MREWLSKRPVVVRLSRALAPIDVISLYPQRNSVIEGVKIRYGVGDSLGQDSSGEDFDVKTLRPGQYVDILVHAGSGFVHEMPYSSCGVLVGLPSGRPLHVAVEWTTVDGAESSGAIRLDWTAEERLRGLSPRVAYGELARNLADFRSGRGRLLDGRLLGHTRRVRDLTNREVRKRVRRERLMTISSDGTEVPLRCTSLSVVGYRGFASQARLHLAVPNGTTGSGLTLVVGANNSGKSTVWESFDAVARKNRNDISFAEERRNARSDTGVRLELAREDGTTYIVESRGAGTSETRARWEPATPPRNQLEIVAVPSRRQFEAYFGRHSNAQPDWMIRGGDFVRGQSLNQFAGRLFDVHNNDDKKTRFDDLLARVVGHHVAWKIDLRSSESGSSYYLKVSTEDGEGHSSEGLGEGIVSLLFIVDALYAANHQTLIVIDEPELSLHPYLVRRLGRVLAEFAKNRQIVLFTHSPFLIDWTDIQNGASIARVHKVGAGSQISQASRPVLDELLKARGSFRLPHTLGINATEVLFLDDGVIVTEGQDDAALLPYAFELCGLDVPATIFGWGAGGESNIGRILALLRDLGYSRVAAVVDNNVSTTLNRLRQDFPEYTVEQIPAADIRDKQAVKAREATYGLFDSSGKNIHPQHLAATRSVLTTIAESLSESSGVMDPHSSGSSSR